MPLVPPAMTALLSGYMASSGITGISNSVFATGVASGFVQYVLSSVTVQTVDVGSAGGGAGTGTGFRLPTSVLVGTLQASFQGAQIRGPMAQPLIASIARAVSDTVGIAVATTVHAGVGVGSGKVTLIPNTLASVPLMQTSFAGVTMTGVSSPVLAAAIAQGIDQALPSTVGVVVIAGPPSPSPGSGTGLGKLL